MIESPAQNFKTNFIPVFFSEKHLQRFVRRNMAGIRIAAQIANEKTIPLTVQCCGEVPEI